MKKTKDYSGKGLKKRLMEVSGIQEPTSHHLNKKDTDLVDVFGLTYGELKKLIQAEVKEYFDETFDKPQVDNDVVDLDEELQKILDELDFELK